MLHLAVILDRAKRRSGQFQPFARGPDGIAARRALAFENPGFLLLGRGRLSTRIQAGMGEGADALQDLRDALSERRGGRWDAHRPDKTILSGGTIIRLRVPLRDGICSSDSLSLWDV